MGAPPWSHSVCGHLRHQRLRFLRSTLAVRRSARAVRSVGVQPSSIPNHERLIDPDEAHAAVNLRHAQRPRVNSGSAGECSGVTSCARTFHVKQRRSDLLVSGTST